MIDIFPTIYLELMQPENVMSNLGKIAFDMLDCEDVTAIMLDGEMFWLEESEYPLVTTARARQWLINYVSYKGYKYLYGETK